VVYNSNIGKLSYNILYFWNDMDIDSQRLFEKLYKKQEYYKVFIAYGMAHSYDYIHSQVSQRRVV